MWTGIIRPFRLMRRSMVLFSMPIFLTLFALLALSATPALAVRGHLFSTTFGSEGSGPGQLSEPNGVAVNQATTGATAGDVYVADFGNSRVQWFSFNAKREYEVAGQITAADGAGTGTLTEGSTKIESFAPSSGTFVVGQTISGEGIPAETKITKVEPEPFVIEISNPVEAGVGIAKPLVPLIAEQPLLKPRAVAVDNSPGGPSSGDVYVSVGEFGEQVVDKFTPSGEFVGQIAHTPTVNAFERVAGIAVDPAGSLWVLEQHQNGQIFEVHHFDGGVANQFQQSCPIPSNPGAGRGLAVDSKDDLYVQTERQDGRGTGGVVEYASQCELLTESLDSQASAAEPGVTFYGVAVESSTSEVYVDNVESVGRFKATGEEVERFGTGNLASSGCNESPSCFGGVAVNAAPGGPTAGDVYAADASNARIVVFTPEEPAAPTVESESVSQVTADSATLQAELNPRTVAGEAPTKYRFEYGPCPGAPATCKGSAYPSSTAGSLPASFEVESVSVPVEGLLASTVYHFRVLASNEHGPAQGAEREGTFTTQATAEFALPDGRQWEMVSPSAMHGALIEPLGNGGLAIGATTQAAAGGGALAYVTNAPTESEPAGYSTVAQVFSTRGSGGWSSQDVSVPHAVPTGIGSNAEEVRFFSEDLSLAVVQPLGSFVALSEDASEQTAYLRNNPAGAYTPLVTGCPAAGPCPPAVQAHADVPPGTVFGQLSAASGNSCPGESACGPEFVGGTPDLKHVVLTAQASLRPGANSKALYGWNAGLPPSQQLQLVSLLPPATLGGPELPAEQPSLGLVSAGDDQRGAVSADGSHVFFSAESHLYMRDTVLGRTVQIDVPEAGCNPACGGGGLEPRFQFASSDGSRVFFTDTQRLTKEGKEYFGNVPADLYVCEVHEDVCALRDLAPAGSVLGELSASEDGSWIYFAANGALAAGALSGGCPGGGPAVTAAPGAICDLYVEHYQAGAWGQPHVVATVSGNDQLDWGIALGVLVARVSPDGRWLAFMSQRSLTGYDNRDAVSGKRDEEVYLYDAEHERLTCASCDPSGARPHGQEFGFKGQNFPLLGYLEWQAQDWLAGSIPAWVRVKNGVALYQPRFLSDSGRLFFDSHDALVPKDVNGTGDVYQYEPEGVGGCSGSAGSGGVVFKPGGEVAPGVVEPAGCVGLLSSGSSGEESAFLDASAAGGDVFFISTAKLSPLDVEGGLTVYDAHECTGSSPCITPPGASPPPCSTEASCKPAPTPQPAIFGAGPSETFSGPGNPAPPPAGKARTAKQVRAEKLAKALRACHRLKKRPKRKRCERAVHRAYSASVRTTPKRATNNWRAGR